MELTNNGFHILGQLVEREACRELENFTSTLPYYVCHSEVDAIRKGLPLRQDGEGHYKVFRLADLLMSPVVQRIISSPQLHDAARDYLGECHLSSVILWKSYPKKGAAVAQQLHRDVYPDKSLAAFIYLTDVSETNGPHTYIRHSHDDKTFRRALAEKEPQLLREASFRWHPKNVAHLLKATPRWRGMVNKTYIRNGAAYDLDGAFKKVAPYLIHTHTGPAGSCLLTEPRGLHRGDPVKEGYRTMLSLRWNKGSRGGLESDVRALLSQVRKTPPR